MSNYYPLNSQQAMEYVDKLGIFPDHSSLVCREIGDGNLNLVFHIKEKSAATGVIIKQALPYARVVGESWPLTLDRARIESEALIVHHCMCPGMVPKVYHYDPGLALTVMEDLSTHIILRKGLMARTAYPLFAKQIGSFLARTLLLTSDIVLDPLEKKNRMIQFSNPEMCKITEDLVFTDPYYDAETNRFNPLLDEEVKKIWGNDKLKYQIAKLKEKFLTHSQALIHGDLHTGSIMVTGNDLKVIDPEFAFYGPMGFDVGALFANLLLSYASQVGHSLSVEERKRKDYQNYLLNTIEQVWLAFEQEFRALWKEQAKEPTAAAKGYVDDYIVRILQDASGFAGCKMLRRVIGLAHVEDLESIEDLESRAKGEKLALGIGQQLVIKGDRIQNIKDITSLVKKVSSDG
ncbi:S-methyl-5-thioribose kinase [Fictibacillus sp. NRS-1165]|uniref:S-methyl-5-thioribose kinase n=1 Tax=Fictibacillus sp. NRS-1165 TaxID=3144463 RepID=UPI003D1E0637